MEKTPEKVVKVPESPSQTKDEDKPSLASLQHKDLQINVIGPDNLNLDIHKKKGKRIYSTVNIPLYTLELCLYNYIYSILKELLTSSR